MSARKKDVQIQVEIANDEQWWEALANPTLFVVDVYQMWCGPCKAVETLFRKIRSEYGDEVRFGVAEASSISDLTIFEGKCQPVFLCYLEGKLVSVVKGVNGPLLQRTILGYIEKQKKKAELGPKYNMDVKEIFLKDYQGSVSPKKPIQEEEKDTDDDELASYHVVIIKPDAVADGQVENIKTKAVDAGYCVVAEEERILTEKEIHDFYQDRADEPDFVEFMSSGPVHALIMKKGENMDDGGPALTEMIDPVQVDVIKPKTKSKDGQEVILERCGDSRELASRQLGFFFPSFDFRTGMMGKKDSKLQRTVALIRPSLVKEKKNEILKAIHDAGFQVAMQREMTLTEEQAREFYKEHEDQDYFPSFISHMTSGPVLALALTRDDAVRHWRNLLGPKILEEAKEKCPESLRSQFAIDDVAINQLHGSSCVEEAQRDLQRFFPVEHTLAVIKPDASQQHKDDIISRIESAGFSISHVKETQMTKEMAENFYKQHHDKSFFNSLVDYMSQGPSVVMILSKENAIAEWREMMGPVDPDQAKEVCPNSMRACFAKSILENAVHGSSAPEQAMDNIRFIFGDVNL